jgi:hypothetical protein
MMTHPEYEVLNDYADDLLDEPAAAHVRAHLDGCVECARVLAQVNALQNEARALPRSVTAPPEIWSAVRAATIDNANATRRRVLQQLRYQLAAAAVVLLVAASTLTWYFTKAGTDMETFTDTGTYTARHANLVAYREVEVEYGKAVDELMQLLAQRRANTDTAVIRSVEENLRIMDEAIKRARAALLSDPDNGDVAGILTATQESKIRMLRRAVGAGGT